VGKSSLLNALAGAELAIVTPIAGTTRDRVSETIQIDGVPLHVTDTAGLRHGSEAADEVERIGIGRSWQAIGSADAVIFLHDLTRCGEPAYDAAESAIAAQLPTGVPVIEVYNKADLCPGAAVPEGALRIAAKGGEGLQALRQALLAQAGWQAAPEGLFIARTRHVQALRETATHLAEAQAHAAQRDAALDLLAEELRLAHQALRQALLAQAGWQAAPEGLFIARTRHVQALRETATHLAEAQAHAAQRDAALDLLAEELRLAHRALCQITGEFTPDDLLGEIFSRFCIGK
jgi:tRNA modification GTPase